MQAPGRRRPAQPRWGWLIPGDEASHHGIFIQASAEPRPAYDVRAVVEGVGIGSEPKQMREGHIRPRHALSPIDIDAVVLDQAIAQPH